jgi:hypothetical protein
MVFGELLSQALKNWSKPVVGSLRQTVRLVSGCQNPYCRDPTAAQRPRTVSGMSECSAGSRGDAMKDRAEKASDGRRRDHRGCRPDGPDAGR